VKSIGRDLGFELSVSFLFGPITLTSTGPERKIVPFLFGLDREKRVRVNFEVMIRRDFGSTETVFG